MKVSTGPNMTVTVPADPANVRILRVMAADAAATADLGFDRFSDLELAVDEAMTLLLATRPRTIETTFRSGSSTVELDVTAHDVTELPDASELSMLVLESVTDEIDLRWERPAARAHLVITDR